MEDKQVVIRMDPPLQNAVPPAVPLPSDDAIGHHVVYGFFGVVPTTGGETGILVGGGQTIDFTANYYEEESVFYDPPVPNNGIPLMADDGSFTFTDDAVTVWMWAYVLGEYPSGDLAGEEGVGNLFNPDFYHPFNQYTTANQPRPRSFYIPGVDMRYSDEDEPGWGIIEGVDSGAAPVKREELIMVTCLPGVPLGPIQVANLVDEPLTIWWLEYGITVIAGGPSSGPGRAWENPGTDEDTDQEPPGALTLDDAPDVLTFTEGEEL